MTDRRYALERAGLVVLSFNAIAYACIYLGLRHWERKNLT